MRSGPYTLVAALLCTAALAAALVCRYTVRDIGFVDLTGPTYRLRLEIPTEWPLAEEQEAALASVRRSSNLIAERAAAEPSAAARWVLSTAEHAPRLVGTPRADALGIEEALQRALHSPVRDAVLAQALDTFAFIVIFEGHDAQENRAVRALLAEVAEGLKALEAQLPRPIALPLRHLSVPHATRDVEDVLLWSLGYDPVASAQQPGVVILYGRGKLAGAARWGQDISAPALLTQLALVGQSCECETDRDWAAEPHIPMMWTDRHRRSAANALGFDPESPMVKAEVVRILRKGGSLKSTDDAQDALAAIAFGYRETNLDQEAAAAPEREFSSDPDGPILAPVTARDTGVRVIEATEGDDWGFEEEPVVQPLQDEEPAQDATTDGADSSATPPPGPTPSGPPVVYGGLPHLPTPVPDRFSWLLMGAGAFVVLCMVIAAIVVISNRKEG